MRRLVVIAGMAVAAGIVAVPVTAVKTPSTRPIRTAVYLLREDLMSSHIDLAMERVRKAGGTAVRLALPWREVAPRRPANPGDPNDPAYRWDYVDRIVTATRDHGLSPLLTVFAPPGWAGGKKVSPKQYGLFAHAAARRYSGSFQDLPRVRYWLAFNEPNLGRYLTPQFRKRKVVSAKRYRKMVNALSSGVWSVHQDNTVVAGLLAPLDTHMGPGALRFMRAFLCVSGGRRPHSTCRSRAHFDAFSVHPYTSGSPSHRAHGHNGAALGNLPEVRAMLRAAVKARHIESNHPVRLWITEFSWDSRPPDPLGVPARVEGRWVAEALYRAWKSRVELLTWFQLRDQSLHSSPYQSGLYYRGKSYTKAKPKPVLKAFRLPFVAYKRGKSRVYVWGRTPPGSRGRAIVERSSGGRWKRVGVLRPNGAGIFFHTYRMHARSSWFLRARLTGGDKKKSLRFSLRRSQDKYYPAFGS